MQRRECVHTAPRISQRRPGWLFGHLAYDLKNETERLQSAHPDHIGFPDLYFFRPLYLLRLQQQELTISGDDLTENEANEIYAACLRELVGAGTAVTWSPFSLQSPVSREYYLQAVKALQEHIRKGDCYEVNFCREQFAQADITDPLLLFRRLNALSPAPFAAYYKTGDKYLACSSPERFLQKQGDRLVSQPIKGTIKRSADPAQDAQLREALLQSAKEQSENVMIVDLVRNDLSRTAVQGSVKVRGAVRHLRPFPYGASHDLNGNGYTGVGASILRTPSATHFPWAP